MLQALAPPHQADTKRPLPPARQDRTRMTRVPLCGLCFLQLDAPNECPLQSCSALLHLHLCEINGQHHDLLASGCQLTLDALGVTCYTYFTSYSIAEKV